MRNEELFLINKQNVYRNYRGFGYSWDQGGYRRALYTHSGKTEFAEYWLARVFADAVKCEEGVKSVYLLERMSDRGFDVAEVIKQAK